MIEIRNISYKDKNNEILRNIKFSIKENECFAILGPNGSGKTTLIELMVSLIKPTHGEIKFFGKDFKDIKNKVGVLFENPPLFYYAKVNEIIDFFTLIYGCENKKVKELIEKLEMEEILKREIRKLSKGEKKKLGLLISLINDPSILILDEPTSGMDPFVRKKIWEIIKSKEKTIIFSTHIWEEAEEYADRVLLLNKGEILAIDSPSNFLSEKYLGFKNKIILRKREDIKGFIEKEFYIETENEIYVYSLNPDEIVKKIKNFEYNFSRVTLEDVFLYLKEKNEKY